MTEEQIHQKFFDSDYTSYVKFLEDELLDALKEKEEWRLKFFKALPDDDN